MKKAQYTRNIATCISQRFSPSVTSIIFELSTAIAYRACNKIVADIKDPSIDHDITDSHETSTIDALGNVLIAAMPLSYPAWMAVRERAEDIAVIASYNYAYRNADNSINSPCYSETENAVMRCLYRTLA